MAFSVTAQTGLNRSCFGGSRLLVQPTPVPRRVSYAFQSVQAGWGRIPKFGPGRHWEHYDLTKNGKPVRIKMHIKKGDTVQVIAGRQKGTVSEITEVNTKTGTVVVKGVNVRTRTIKARTKEEKPRKEERESPIHHSNVMLYSNAEGVVSRVGKKVVDGVKKRYLVKTGEILS